MWLLAQIAVTIWCAGFAFQVSTKSFFWAKFWYLVANDFVGVNWQGKNYQRLAFISSVHPKFGYRPAEYNGVKVHI